MNNAGNIHHNRTAGLMCVFLFVAAFLVGFYSILINDVLIACAYFVVVMTGYVLNVYYYCRKCPHVENNSCRFVVWGKLACLFPKGKIGTEYSFRDVIIILFPRLFMVFFPRPWLHDQKILFIVFWALVLFALFLWVSFACPTCGNEKCSFRKRVAFQKKWWRKYDAETGAGKECR